MKCEWCYLSIDYVDIGINTALLQCWFLCPHHTLWIYKHSIFNIGHFFSIATASKILIYIHFHWLRPISYFCFIFFIFFPCFHMVFFSGLKIKNCLICWLGALSAKLLAIFKGYFLLYYYSKWCVCAVGDGTNFTENRHILNFQIQPVH